MSFPPRNRGLRNPGARATGTTRSPRRPRQCVRRLEHRPRSILHRHLLDALHDGDRGEKFEHLAVLRGLNCPGVLVEPAFISSDVEGARLARPRHTGTRSRRRSLRASRTTPPSPGASSHAGPSPGPARCAGSSPRSPPTRPSPSREQAAKSLERRGARFLRRAHLLDVPGGSGRRDRAPRLHPDRPDQHLRADARPHPEKPGGGLPRGRPHAPPARRGRRLPPRREAHRLRAPSAVTRGSCRAPAWRRGPTSRRRMRARTRHASSWSGRLTARERELEAPIFDALAAGGPIGPEEFNDERQDAAGLGFGHAGEVDPPEALLPRASPHRGAPGQPEALRPSRAGAAGGRACRARSTPEETARWSAVTRLRQHRLVALTRSELALVGDVVQAVAIEGCPLLHCLSEDLHLL
jgi:hypothetical protein